MTETRIVQLDELHGDEHNARRHPERNRAAVRESLAKFGAGRSLVADAAGTIRAGNGTLEEARTLGFREAVVVTPEPGQLVVVQREDWTPAQAAGYAIADNRTAELAEWDPVELANARAAFGEDLALPGWTPVEWADAAKVQEEREAREREIIGGPRLPDPGQRTPTPLAPPEAVAALDRLTTTKPDLTSPIPWFGGKARVSAEIWARLGIDAASYIEPFAGGLGCLLGRPGGAGRNEIVNDADGLLANFWRALVHAPDAVVAAADWPVNEVDLHARHLWLVGRREDLTARLMGDPDWYDAKAAGWWAWGISCWIGSGWCDGSGPLSVRDGILVREARGASAGAVAQMPDCTGGGKGVHALGASAQMSYVHREQGINCVEQRPPLTHDNAVVTASGLDRLRAVASRIRRVRVCCGDWTRVVTHAVTHAHTPTAILLDPPYDIGERAEVYAQEDAGGLSAAVRRWALAHGTDPALRIALCGYEGEHEMPGWTEAAWSAAGGYGNQGEGRGADNRHRERVWFSPHCLVPGKGPTT